MRRHRPAVNGEPDQHPEPAQARALPLPGNAAGSALRLTLGCLLGLELRRVGSGKRMTFGAAGEAALSLWMADNARVCWIEREEPWALESELITTVDLPLNLDQNRHNAFHGRLKEMRAQARARARELPVSP
ncbi:GIY-YIG nuclease family protein [Streptomyces sp. NPDC048518]|uniref:GIY-YIG nuclease family protein n=1 Tax=Streptomyces sp. NPDC048518 TaxID=3155029 RepID=UPI0033D6612F